MSTDLAGSVTAEYTAAVPRPDDGENLTAASLTNLVLPTLNRIEYLRQGLESAPWRQAIIFDDFVTRDENPAGDLIDFGAGGWEHSSLTNWDLGTNNRPNTIGLLELSNSSGSAATLRLSKGTPSVLASFGQLSRIVAKVLTQSIATGNEFEVGLFNSNSSDPGITGGGEKCVSAYFDPAVSANWQLRVDNGTQSLTDTGVPVVVDTLFELALQQNGSGQFTLSVDGATPVVEGPNVPGDSDACCLALRFATPNSGGSRLWAIDFIRAEFEASARVV